MESKCRIRFVGALIITGCLVVCASIGFAAECIGWMW